MALVAPVVHAIPGFCQPFSSLSHLAAAAVALVAAISLIKLGRGSRGRLAVVIVYASCVVTTLTVSGLYHAMWWESPARITMQRCDHYAIWLLIAGTFTAFHGIMCRGFWRTGVLTIIWTYAACGVVLQTLWFEEFSGPAGLVLYLGLGWIGVASIVKLGREIGFRAVRPVLYAGIAYSVGAVLEAMGGPLLFGRWFGPHEIFHVAVIVGVTLHWLFVRQILLRHRPRVQLAPVVSVAPSRALAAPPVTGGEIAPVDARLPLVVSASGP